MRHAWVAVAVVALAAPAASAPARGPWPSLLKKGASWTLALTSDANAASPPTLRVTVEDVRKLGGADIVKLGYTCGPDDDSCHNPLLVHAVAITAGGVYTVDGLATDAAITKALAKSPLVADPPRGVAPSQRTGGAFAIVPKQRKAAICIGHVDLPDADGVGCGAAPCAGWVCVDATGVVGAGDVGDSGAQYGFVPDAIPD